MKISFIISILFLSFQSLANEHSLIINPRYDFIQSDKTLMNKPFIKTQGSWSHSDWRFSGEAFAENDFVSTPAQERRTESQIVLQELYGEWNHENFLIRIGRQPIRWSESWVLPSLDLFTARRWNRLFFDPLPEQLIHSDGILLSLEKFNFLFEYFSALQPSVNQFPKPWPDGNEHEWNPEHGLRITKKIAGFDTKWILFHSQSVDSGGLSATYAFSDSVAKLEWGHDRLGNEFLTIGFDIFWQDWTLSPQWTKYHDATSIIEPNVNIYYLPIIFKLNKHSLEAQFLSQYDQLDVFSSVSYTYDITDTIRSSFFIQKYEGADNHLLGTYQKMTGDACIGFRFEINTSI